MGWAGLALKNGQQCRSSDGEDFRGICEAVRFAPFQGNEITVLAGTCEMPAAARKVNRLKFHRS